MVKKPKIKNNVTKKNPEFFMMNEILSRIVYTLSPRNDRKSCYFLLSRIIYLLIKKYTHFAYNQNFAMGNKVAKVLLLSILFNSSIVEIGIFHEDFFIDESMVPHFGKHGTKMFIEESYFVLDTRSVRSVEATGTFTICKFTKIKNLENPHNLSGVGS